MSSHSTTPSSFEAAVHELELGFHVFQLRDKPAELTTAVTDRVKLAAKYLAKASGVQHSAALEAVAQAVRFKDWHELSEYLARPARLAEAKLPARWSDALSSVLLLLAEQEPDLAMPQVQLQAFERLAQTLAMLTDISTEAVLDGVCAPLCAGRTWREVRDRNPLKTAQPLYQFKQVMPEESPDGKLTGYFDSSRACLALVEELDRRWQGYRQLTKLEQRRARVWVEDALASQPGFLEGGLALASMQRDGDEPAAPATLDRFIRQTEALIPPGFKGLIPWVHVENRFYHRMLWLRLEMYYEADEVPAAVRLARKLLRLNPNDNMGVRFVLPLLLMQLREFGAAKRATKALEGEGMTGALARAFCEFGLGNRMAFRHEFAEALVTLPLLRRLLLNQREPLPEGDDGFRGIQPELETFLEFAWPVYTEVPGLRAACRAFLAEPKVLEIESGLRRYWKHYRGTGSQKTGSHTEWTSLCADAIDELSQLPALQRMR